MSSIFDKLGTYLSNNNSTKVHDELNFTKNNLGKQCNKSKKHKISSIFTKIRKYNQYLQANTECAKTDEDIKYIRNKLKECDDRFKELDKQCKEYNNKRKEYDDKFKELNNQIREIELTDYNANHFTQFAMNIVNDSSDE